MMRYVVVALRLLLIMVFLVGMPVLALPPVADWCEAQLYARAGRRVVAARPSPTPKVVAVTEVSTDKTPLLDVSQARYLEPAAALPAKEPERADPARLAAEVESLGATFYRLEQLQEQPPLYRFIAQFERAADVPVREQFAANGSDPGAAIADVITQIRARR